jgi:FkbM family methyltransferase
LTIKRDLYRAFNRSTGRPLLALARSVALLTKGELAWVAFDPQTQAWIHHYYHDDVLVSPEPRGMTASQADHLTREVFLRHYEAQAGDVVLDIGAGVGTETLPLARMVGSSGRVLAVEAHPATFRILSRMCSLNDLTQVEPIQAGAMDREGPVTISDLDPGDSQANKIGAIGVEVPGTTINSLVKERDLPRVDFLKMNIEGAEVAALEGASDVLSLVRFAAISCHDFLADQTGDQSYRTKGRVRELLLNAGFDVVGRDSDPRPWVRDYLYARRG